MKNNFSQYNLSDDLIKAIDMLNYKEPSEVQKKVIPLILNKKDVIVKSQTGSGKTAAFAIPLCELIDWDQKDVQALVLTPTRELAKQVKEDIFNIGRFKRIKCVGMHGGESFIRQEKELKQKTHIAVGTPGRVLDHIDSGTFYTKNIKYLIIDEADEMLSMGFIDEVKWILQEMNKNIVTVLLSATMEEKINEIIKNYMHNPIKVEIENGSINKPKIDYEFYESTENEKHNLLQDITILENPDSCIIFCNTQTCVDFVDEHLYDNGYSCNKIHGGMDQSDRTSIMNRFKKNEFRYLIATDVAARGIDVDDISLVINYDIPEKSETFVHRTGRTARNGKKGKAISFVNKKDLDSFEMIKDILELDNLLLPTPKKELVELNKEKFDKKTNEKLEIKNDKGATLSQDILKIHINAGKKTKMRAVDIVGTFCDIDGMTAKDIGIINILDISTFVEILNGKGEMVLEALQNKNIKGRPRIVSRVE